MYSNSNPVNRFSSLIMVAAMGLMGEAMATKPLTPDDLQKMSPREARLAVLKQVEAQRLARLTAPVGAMDVTPPVLTKFSAKSKFDASKPYTTPQVDMSFKDDLSGLNWVYAYASGPAGQTAVVSYYSNYPITKGKAVMGSDSWSRSRNIYLAPGVYNYDYAYATDAAGNWAYYDNASLAALGGVTAFTVTNSAGYDNSAPSLVSGEVLTTSVSATSYQPGTESPPYVGLKVNLSDAGSTLVSGVVDAWASFCTVDGFECINLSATNSAPQSSEVTLMLGGRVYEGQTAAKYKLYSIGVSDVAGNYRYYYSKEFGGDTDFTAYFPSTVIKINP